MECLRWSISGGASQVEYLRWSISVEYLRSSIPGGVSQVKYPRWIFLLLLVCLLLLVSFFVSLTVNSCSLPFTRYTGSL